MKLFISLFIFSLFSFTKITSAQALLGFTAGYDDHFLQVGISIYNKGQKQIFNRRGTAAYSNNLNNKTSGYSFLFTTGHIICLGFDGQILYPMDHEAYPFLFKPKIGLGLPKYGTINYGYNMLTNGNRYWTWSVDLNIPIYQLHKSKKTTK